MGAIFLPGKWGSIRAGGRLSNYALNMEIGSRLAGKEFGAQPNGSPSEAGFLRQLYIIGDKSQLRVLFGWAGPGEIVTLSPPHEGWGARRGC